MERTGESRRFTMLLLLIVLAGGALRVGYVMTVTRHDHHLYDATYYAMQTDSIAHGGGFFHDPFLLYRDAGNVQPAADHPPLTVLALLPAALLSGPGQGDLAMRLTTMAAGTAAVALTGLLGRKVAGPKVGLLAAGLAALDPNLWMNDGLIMSESFAVLETLVLLLLVYRVLEGRTGWTWPVAMGAVAALATLTRAELALYLPLLALPALVLANRRRDRGWLGPAALSVASFGLVLAPWVTFNMARFEEPTTVSTTLGMAVSTSNCPAVYSGEMLGSSAVLECAGNRNDAEQSVWDAQLRKAGLSYMYHNAERLPVVAAARLGRVWNVYRVSHTITLASYEGHPKWGGWMAAGITWLLVPVAVAGGVVLRRRGQALWPLLMPLAAITAVLLTISGGLTRYRAPAEPGLLVLAAFAIAALPAVRQRRGLSQ